MQFLQTWYSIFTIQNMFVFPVTLGLLAYNVQEIEGWQGYYLSEIVMMFTIQSLREFLQGFTAYAVIIGYFVNIARRLYEVCMSGYLWGLIRLIGRGNLRQAGRDVRAAMVAFHWNLVVWVLDSVFEMVLVVMGRQILPGGSEAGKTVVSAALVWVVRWVFDSLKFFERQKRNSW